MPGKLRMDTFIVLPKIIRGQLWTVFLK